MSVASNNITTSSAASRAARPSPLACRECRKRHLKCDAQQPVCGRCAASEILCEYTPSRRGYRGPSKRRPTFDQPDPRRCLPPFERRHSAVSDAEAESSTFTPLEAAPTSFPTTSTYTLSEHTSADTAAPSSYTYQAALEKATDRTQPTLAAYPNPNAEQQGQDDEQLVNLYYVNFHTAHPILVPKPLYYDQRYSKYLRLVVQFIGSHYCSSVSSDSLRAAIAAETASRPPRSLHTVQALLLLSIALHARNDVRDAQTYLAQAVDYAIALGMHRENFAELHGRGDSIQEESMRRTWWELFITDGFMAALHRKSGFKSNRVEADVRLPCEETVYAEGGYLPITATMDQFDSRLFAEEEMEFSSFTYRIEAVRILARVLAIAGTGDVHEDQVQAVDNTLAGWVHHLPQTKADIINTYGEVDEMLFQAHMIIQCANIFLHYPRSDLLSTLPQTAEIACAYGDKHVSPASTHHIHAVKATDASKELSNLAALRLPVQKHTPFFVCSLVLSAIVQLSACSVHACRCLEQHRDRVALLVGVLKSISQTWAIARIVLQQVKKVASEVLQAPCKPTPPPAEPWSAQDSGIDMGPGCPAPHEEMPWFDFFDNQGVNGFMQLETPINFTP